MNNVTPIESKQPAPAAKFIITCTLDGFPISIEAEGNADSLRNLVARLKAIGATPPQATSKASSAVGTPTCPIHNTPMKPSRKPGKFYCVKKAEDGEYCRETV